MDPNVVTAMNGAQRSIESLTKFSFIEGVQVTATASSQLDTAHTPTQACSGVITPTTFSTTGSLALSVQDGWKGTGVSDNSGVLATAENITFSYAPAISADSFWVIGRRGNYPVDFTVESSPDGTTWTTEATVTGNTSYLWSLRLAAAKSIQQVRITITKISAMNDNPQLIEAGAVTQVILTSPDIIDLDITEEIGAQSNNPISTVTSNEFTATLNNVGGWFSPNNENSPLYSLIKPGVLIEQHLGVKMPDATYTFTIMGTFYLLDWDASSDGLSVPIIARDRLNSLLTKALPRLLPSLNITIASFFDILFKGIGLQPSEYSIDSTLTRNLQVAWLPSGKVRDVIQSLAEAGLCAVTMSRDNIVRVIDLLPSGTSVADLTAQEQIISYQNKHSYRNIFSSVEVAYNTPYLGDSTVLKQLENISLPASTDVQIASTPFDIPAGNIEYMLVQGAPGCYVKSATIGSSGASLTLTNPGTTAYTGTLIIRGKAIELAEATVTATDAIAQAQWPDNILHIGNQYVQSETVASDYATNLIKFCTNPKAFHSITARGNMFIQIYDTVIVKADPSIDVVNDITAQVIRAVYRYDGGLSAEMILRDPIT